VNDFVYALFFSILVLPTMIWLFMSLITKDNKPKWIGLLLLYTILKYYVATYYGIEIYKWDWV